MGLAASCLIFFFFSSEMLPGTSLNRMSSFTGLTLGAFFCLSSSCSRSLAARSVSIYFSLSISLRLWAAISASAYSFLSRRPCSAILAFSMASLPSSFAWRFIWSIRCCSLSMMACFSRSYAIMLALSSSIRDLSLACASLSLRSISSFSN